MNQNIRKTIHLNEDTIDQINILAASKHINFSEAVRHLIEESLDVEAARANQSLIRNYIHEEVNTSLGPYMSQITGILEKRIIPICAKASRTSAISFALIIGMLTENYTDGRTHEQLLSTAMKYAGQYLKEKPHSEEEYLAAAREVLNSAYGFSNTDDGI